MKTTARALRSTGLGARLSTAMFVLSAGGVLVTLAVQGYRGRRGPEVARIAFTSAAPADGSAHASPEAGARVRVWFRQNAAYHFDETMPGFDRRSSAEHGPPVSYQLEVTQGERTIYRAMLTEQDCEYLSWGLGHRAGHSYQYDRDCATSGRFVAPGGPMEIHARFAPRFARAIDRAEDLSVVLYRDP